MSVDEERIDRTFSVGATPELSITNVTGSTDVRVWDARAIRIVASKRPGGTIPFAPVAEGFQATKISMEQQGDTITVKTNTDYQGVWSFLRWLGGVALVDYLAYVPADCSVVVSQATGSLSVQGLLGSMVARTVSASITARDLAGSVALSTVSGRIECESVRGKLAVKGVSGRVRVERSHLLSFSGKTVAGNIDLTLVPTPGATYELETVSGDARVVIPPGLGVSARLDSTSGSIVSGSSGRSLIVHAAPRSFSSSCAGSNARRPSLRIVAISGNDMQPLQPAAIAASCGRVSRNQPNSK